MATRYRLAALLLLIGVGGAAFWRFVLEARVRALFTGNYTPTATDFFGGQLALEQTPADLSDAFRYEGAEAALELIDVERSEALFDSDGSKRTLDSARAQVLCALDRHADAEAVMATLPDPRSARVFCEKAQAFRAADRACSDGQQERAAERFQQVYGLKEPLDGLAVCKGFSHPRERKRWVR